MPVARTLTVALCLAAVLAAASARAAEDLQRWVERALAPAAADYHGTVVLQIGDKMQTLRVTHLLADGKPLEWVEVLEGAPRETIRIGDEVRCFLPEDRVVLIDRAAGAAGLSYHPVGSVGRIESSYRLESLGMDRVAGREVFGVRFVPRDALRFGQDWWIDRESAVVLKRVVWEETPARALETQTFSDFQLGAATQAAVVRQKFASRSEWQRVDLRGKSVGAGETGLGFGALPPGFQLEGILQRRGPRARRSRSGSSVMGSLPCRSSSSPGREPRPPSKSNVSARRRWCGARIRVPCVPPWGKCRLRRCKPSWPP